MKLYWGGNARFRDPSEAIIAAKYFYGYEGPKISDETEELLKHLLQAEIECEDYSALRGQSAHVFDVIPRPGTTPPWSSKAMSILAAVGVPCDHLIRGVRYFARKEVHRDAYHDRMTEVVRSPTDTLVLKRPRRRQDEMAIPAAKIPEINESLGLALDDHELEYLGNAIQERGSITEAELMMFAQVNSEHCRHKTFNTKFTVDNLEQHATLFGMIRETHKTNPDLTLSAYKDNAAVIQSVVPQKGQIGIREDSYEWCLEPTHTVLKVETHNHPTGVAPYQGSATGSGGEIRDEGAVGQGSRPKFAISGFLTSHLKIDGFSHSWELEQRAPHLASPLQIMIDAPLGAANYNNEFGRCHLSGFFRTFSHKADGRDFGYVKPIMIAGGVGTIRESHIEKQTLRQGDKIAVLGGPGLLIGIGGGAASSLTHGSSSVDLDFASVQRENAEMERRCQCVIDACTSMGCDNPILSIHDVGAGGLSNAVPELVEELGAVVDLDKVPVADIGLSPMEIWCNESQERYVIATRRPAVLQKLAEREQCPLAIIGTVEETKRLRVERRSEETGLSIPVVDLPMATLFGRPPLAPKNDFRVSITALNAPEISMDLESAIWEVLAIPAVASKSFLVTIGDRFIGGQTVQDQMVGKWQVPVADAAITLASLDSGRTGEVIGIGERPALSLISSPSSARMALGESLTNILSAHIEEIHSIRCSANWMAAAKEAGEGAKLYDAVHALTTLCTSLGISIPVGKDSLSMKASWDKGSVTSPMSVIVTGVGHTWDVRMSLTPELQVFAEETVLLLVDLALGRTRMGGSCLFHVMKALGNEAPDFEDVEIFKAFATAMSHCRKAGLLYAYHDRSDGGLVTTVLEMSFASRVAVHMHHFSKEFLFNEELGVVLQAKAADVQTVRQWFSDAGFPAEHVIEVATIDPTFRRTMSRKDLRFKISDYYDHDLLDLQKRWSETSYRISCVRDGLSASQSELACATDPNDPGLHLDLTYEIPTPLPSPTKRHKIGVIRDPGVNGHWDMACCFMRVGFDVLDITSAELATKPGVLDELRALAFPGGFSYGDVLGAGRGWAANMRHHLPQERLRSFLNRSDTFVLGICNGCQAVSELMDWPRWTRNESGRFEARVVMVEITDDRSLFFRGMKGSKLPVCLAHAEGRLSETPRFPALRYTQSRYPQNPSGSIDNVAGYTDETGRVLVMMPHPERLGHMENMRAYYRPPSSFPSSPSFSPLIPSNTKSNAAAVSPWMQLFVNAARFCDSVN